MKIIPMPNCIEYKKGTATFQADSEYVNYIKSEEFSDSEYQIDVLSDAVTVKAKDEKGFFYAKMTLLQMVNAYINQNEITLPLVTIKDNPRFSYRGFMLDCARHFFDVAEVKKLIDACSKFKINYFHWHLADDQGFRFESKAFPLLTEIGSKRKETRGDNKPVSGFYTKEEMKDIVAYAKERFIEIIPEIDVPGHATAIIAAYPNLSCSGQKIDVETTFGIKKNLLCAGNEENYGFLEKLLDEVIEIFPCEFIHLGGDEADKPEWHKCKKCQDLLKKQGLKNMEELQAYFTARIVSYLKGKGKIAVCWNESLNSKKLDDSVIVQYWSDGKKPLRVLNAVNSGRNVIFSKFTPYYLDYPHGMHTLKMVYNAEPVLDGVDESSINNIKGVEAPVWTEHIPTTEKLEAQIFPRLLAVAEAGWTCPQNKNYKSFKKRLVNSLDLLESLDINYTKKPDVNKIKGLIQTAAFFIKAIDLKTVKEAYKAQKNQIKSRKQG